jgi:23S rRNA (cytosine1962-C5)-methyltransferase
MIQIFLKRDRDAPIRRGHPWVFSGAVEQIEGDANSAGIADVFDNKKNWLARGHYNPATPLRVRLLTWKNEAVDERFIAKRLGHAFALRTNYFTEKTNAYRVVNGEGDFLPGLIVDRYADFCVCQFLTAGMETLKPEIVAALTALSPFAGIFERSEGRVRQEEGMSDSVGPLAGEAPPELMTIVENGHKFLVDIRGGQKTGFFLDQRDNRAFLAGFARDRTVLNCFAYSGGFSVYAFAAGAKAVVTFDSSHPALQIAEKNLTLNGIAESQQDLIKGDAFAYLKETDQTFDVIVLDPPSLAHKRSDVDAAAGGYKFLNLHALKHLNPGGILLTFSCSQHLPAELFQKIVFGAAVDAGRSATILGRLGAPIDHPVSLHHPEGEYLKGLALRVLD